MSSFTDFGLDATILQALERMGFKEPTDIQAQTIPLIQKKQDLIGLAETGSGKTAACAIPVCDRVDTDSTAVQALIIVPTRELALQYATEAQKVGKIKQVKTFALMGGEDASMQESKLANGVQVLVATPGRLIDFVFSRRIDLSHVETLILDEADEMLSMGFYEDLEFIIQCLVHEHQTLLFSATMPKEIRQIAQQHMIDPKEIRLITKKASPKNIEHRFLYCKPQQKNSELIKQLKEENPNQAIIFCRSRIECEKVCGVLRREWKGVDFLHAGLQQNMRSSITNKFRTGKIRFLVATDVAARGLDFSGVTHVFIYHLAEDPEIYVHRSGRTGRSGRSGIVVTLVSQSELHNVGRVAKQIDREPKWIGEPPPKGGSGDRPQQQRPRRRPPRA